MKKKLLDFDSSSSLKMFKIEIWLILFTVLAFLFTFTFLFGIIRLSNHIRKSELIINSLFEISFPLSRSLSAISLIILFYNVYFMIYKSILTNNIKTNTVIVNTSELIDSREDLLNTKR